MATKKEQIERIKNEMNEVLASCATKKEEYLNFLNFSLDCKKYSANNRAILMKRKAPVVKTMKQWNDAGYKIKKGASPIILLRPSFYEGFYRDNVWVPIAKATEEEKKKIQLGEIKLRKGQNFSTFAVFDIKDTDASEEKIIYENEEKNMSYDLQAVLQASGITLLQLVDKIEEKIHKYSESVTEYKEIYESSVMYCCGRTLGFDTMTNNFNLFSRNEVEDIKTFAKIKKIMDKVIIDSEEVVKEVIFC